MKQVINLIIVSLLISSFLACVSARRLQDEQALTASLSEENENCKRKLTDALENSYGSNEQITKMKKDIRNLQLDTTMYGERYRKVENLNKRLNELYEKVISQNKYLLSMSSSEAERLGLDVDAKQRELLIREKEIKDLSRDLQEREIRLKELEGILSKKDEAVNALKNKISKALLSFNKSDLSVKVKNGKVYVSMSDKLLFKSGSTTVDPKGVTALNKLAGVLETNRDINILIEGHTDNVSVRSSDRMKDNWDLSVLRATSITRILTEDNNIDAKRIMASGRSKYHPKASNSTADGKQKNRRTEIILTPKLDELFKILENN